MTAKILTTFFTLMLVAGCADTSAPADTVPGVESDVAAAPAQDVTALVAAADAADGRRMYILCQSCHSINEGGINKIGPNLYGIVGQPAGEVEGFVFSASLLQSGLVWDAETLDAWLANPSRLVPGTTMVFGGIPGAQQRAALIAYLQESGPRP